jgi:GDP-L-fucose synthase
MKILIFGATGFIGKSLFATLEREGHDVVGGSRKNGMDLTDFDSIRKHLHDIQPEIVVDCAAHVGNVHYGMKYPAYIVHDNMMMTLNLYRAVAEVCPQATIINPIANCSYPMKAKIQSEPEWWDGQPHFSALAYASSRRMIYVLATCYKQQYNINSRNFIFPGVYGPGDHMDIARVHALDGMIIRMIQAKRQKLLEFEIWGSGKPIREWCYIDDVVRLMIRGMSIQEDITYPVNFAQNKGYSIRELAEMIADSIGYDKGKLIFNTAYEDGAAIKVLDDKRFKEIFPDFEFCDIKTGIQKSVEYYESVL